MHKNTQKPTKDFFVVINLTNFKVSLSSDRNIIASIIGIHRNTLRSLKDRGTFKEHLVVRVNMQ